MIKKLLLILLSITFFSTSTVFAYEVQILSAVVKDQVIPDATVILQKNGEASVQVKTGADGKASFCTPFRGIDDSTISMIVKKDGYSNLVVKCPCSGLTYAISPTMDSLDGMRIVLNWGSKPEDLDAHLVYPGNHVYFSNKKGDHANLDVDQMYGYGPETITLTKKMPGVKYLYAVHNYTDGNTTGSTSLSNYSHAKVFVYIGSSLVRTFIPPKGRIGNTWIVFGIGANGEFYDINKFDDFQKREDVGTLLTKIIDKYDFASIPNQSNSQTIYEIASSPIQSNSQAIDLEQNLDKSDSKSIPNITRNQALLADNLNKKGEKAYRSQNYDEAESYYLDAINNNPEHSQAYSNLGLLYLRMGKNAEALWANRKSIALASGPNKNRIRAASYYNIGKIYEAKGEWEDALKNFQLAKSLKQNPAYDSAIAKMKQNIGQ